jgi:16S rRNA (uracil1498-N3)-methyltransferase
VIVYQAIIRPEHFVWLLQKGTEIGVSRFVPVLSTRSQHGGPPSAARTARLRAILCEAAEQSRRLFVPALGEAMPFDRAVESIGAAVGQCPTSLGVLLWEGEEERCLSEALRPAVGRGGTVHLLVGPEGGWSAEEVARARGAGLHALSLGPRLLRAETAALVAATGLLALAGDLL